MVSGSHQLVISATLCLSSAILAELHVCAWSPEGRYQMREKSSDVVHALELHVIVLLFIDAGMSRNECSSYIVFLFSKVLL